MEDMLAGGCAHRSRQKQQTGEVERAIRHSFSLRGETVELYGRMDAFTDGPTPLVEEMKLSRHTGDAPLPEHRAQALVYAAMAALEEELGTSLFIRGNKKITLTEKGILL